LVDVFSHISEFGVLIVIACVFIWDKVATGKNVEKMIIEIKLNDEKHHTLLEEVAAELRKTREAINTGTIALLQEKIFHDEK